MYMYVIWYNLAIFCQTWVSAIFFGHLLAFLGSKQPEKMTEIQAMPDCVKHVFINWFIY